MRSDFSSSSIDGTTKHELAEKDSSLHAAPNQWAWSARANLAAGAARTTCNLKGGRAWVPTECNNKQLASQQQLRNTHGTGT